MDDLRVIALVGAKGGCGVTLLAANLASAIARTASVCVLDLDFSRGDLAGVLDLEPPHTLPELMGPGTDATLLRGCATRHPDGFSVLAQPSDMRRRVQPSAADVQRLIAAAREGWGVLVLDLGSHVDDAALAALARADEVLLVATHDVLAFRDLVRVRNLLLRGAGIADGTIRVVLNKVPSGRAPDIDELAELASVEVAASVRRDESAAELSLAAGRVVKAVLPRSVVARDVDELWQILSPAESTPRRWHLPWLGGTA